jgi:putative transposase
MPRAPRTIVPGETYHVFTRGSNKLPIFFDDSDYSDFLELLGLVVIRDGWSLFTYCLMPNHYHLLLRVGDAGLSDGMRELNGGFSRRTSVKYGRTAHLFKNRFKDVHEQTDEQFRHTARYIVLNPVVSEPQICSHPRQWRWSSYRAIAGYERAPSWLDVDGILAHFGGPDPRKSYREFVEAAVPVSDTVADLQRLVHSRL